MPHAFSRALAEEILPRLDALADQGELVTRMVMTLAQEIIEGTLPAGYELTSVELGKRFRTSRTPVREALAILSREGLVEIRVRRRAHVARISRHEVHDLYHVRAALYRLVSREIVRTCTDEQIRRLAVPLRLMEQAVSEKDVDAYFAQSVSFRHLEASICGNEVVGHIVDSLGLRVYRLRRFGLTLPGRLTASLEDHRRLYEAYLERNETLSCAVTESLVLRALAALEQHFGDWA